MQTSKRNLFDVRFHMTERDFQNLNFSRILGNKNWQGEFLSFIIPVNAETFEFSATNCFLQTECRL